MFDSLVDFLQTNIYELNGHEVLHDHLIHIYWFEGNQLMNQT